MRRLDAPYPALICAGECTAFVAEESGLFEVVWQRTAVDRDKRTVTSYRTPVNGGRGQFLACAGFAGDQHRCFAVRHLADRAEQILHRRARAHDFVQRGRSCGRIVQRDHTVFVADGFDDTVQHTRHGKKAGKIVTDDGAQAVVIDLMAGKHPNPANIFRVEARPERSDFTRREAAGEIEDSHGQCILQKMTPHRVCGLKHHDLPVVTLKHFSQLLLRPVRNINKRSASFSVHTSASYG